MGVLVLSPLGHELPPRTVSHSFQGAPCWFAKLHQLVKSKHKKATKPKKTYISIIILTVMEESVCTIEQIKPILENNLQELLNLNLFSKSGHKCLLSCISDEYIYQKSSPPTEFFFLRPAEVCTLHKSIQLAFLFLFVKG